MISPRKPLASLSLDLDNQWSYMKTHGDQAWAKFPSYLDLLVPRVLELLEKHSLKITFFIVGQDAALGSNRAALKKIADSGHEIGNHSFHHEPWLNEYTPDEIEAELEAAESAIREATGVQPCGFRGPGYSFSPTLLHALARRGYRYDASTFPTFIGPLARAYYFLNARLSAEERKVRKNLFGGVRDGLRPLKAYYWDLDGTPLLEIPVTTMPLFRTPFHLSYILYLAGWAPSVACAYFRTALQLCRLTGVQPSLLLHPLDFIGGDDIKDLEFFPAMRIKARTKIELADRALAMYRELFCVVPLRQHAEALIAGKGLDQVSPGRDVHGSGATAHSPHADRQEAA
jgi:peptidoglycan/xylan/chitin deacetylase (PgdA/CDA1 family)